VKKKFAHRLGQQYDLEFLARVVGERKATLRGEQGEGRRIIILFCEGEGGVRRHTASTPAFGIKHEKRGGGKGGTSLRL